MKKRVWKKLISLGLALILCVQLLPMTALAALLDNDPAYNQQILAALADIVGSEDEAERYYAILQQYGLLDEDGNMPESWEIWMDGKQITLGDIRALLDSGDYDPDHYILVDNTPITLGDLKTILEIEDYLAYLQATYFDGHQWTAEQQESLQSLLDQINSEGIMFRAAPGAGAADDGRAPSGVYHDVTASVTVNEVTKDYYTFTVSLSKAQTVDVTFEYWDISGSWNAFAALKQGTIEAGETTATFRVENENYTGSGIYSGSSKVNGTATAVLRLCSLKNALFENGRANYSTVLTINSTYGFSSADTTATATIRGPEPGSDLNAVGMYLSQELKDEKGNEGTEEDAANLLIDTMLLTNYRLEFYPGDIIPIVVRFSCPMQITADMTLNVNNRALHPYSDEVGNTADTCMFPYVVDEADATYLQFADVTDPNTYQLSGKGASDQDVTVTIKYDDDTDTGTTSTDKLTENASADRIEKLNAFIEANPKFFSSATVAKSSKLEYFTIVAPVKSDAITGLSATLENPTTAPAVKVTAEVSDNENLTTWLLNDLKQSEGGSGFETQTLQVSIDGGKTLYPLTTTADTLTGGTLTASIPLELNMTAAEKTYTVELYLDDNKVDISGQYFAPYGEFWTYHAGKIRETSNSGGSVSGDNLARMLHNGLELTDDFYRGYQSFDFSIYDFNNQDGYKYNFEEAIYNAETGETESKEVITCTPGADDAVDYPQYLYGADGTRYHLEYIKDYEIYTATDFMKGTSLHRLVITRNDDNTRVSDTEMSLFSSLYYFSEGKLYYLDENEDTTVYTSDEPVAVYGYGPNALGELSMRGGYLPRSNFYYVNQDGVVGNGLIYGKCATATQEPVKFIDEDSLGKPTVTVLDAAGQPYVGEDVGDQSVIYIQEISSITAGFDLTGSGFTFGDKTSVTTYQLDPDTGLYAIEDGHYILNDPDAHFVWSSSSPAIANIDAQGVVTPTGKAGSVHFTITALNGGVEGKAVSADSEKLTFGAGLTPFLSIPNNALTSVAGQDVTVFWTSNISDKNGANETTFNVTVTVPTKNEISGETKEETVWSTTVKGTASVPAASVTIPGSVLSYTYGGASNTFTVTVETTYEGNTYSENATITLSSQPATVTLDKLDSYYITDKAGSVDIKWEIKNFDRFSSQEDSDLFKFEVTRDGKPVFSGSLPGTEITANSGHYTGSYDLTIPGITASSSDPTSYRQVYTVTIQAKNGSDSTWSYDSFMLYVYDADALKIWVSGKDQSSVTLSNVAEISQMSSADILALKRDIYLKDIVSVNYGEYAWSEIADQIAWASGDNSVATVNYQQGTLYENIENFSYVSYRPTTEFGLSGISDGTATITATHKLTGIQDTLTVNVETLKDKLYLFQCYPQTDTSLTYSAYTDENHTATEEKTLWTNSKGEAAIYAPYGIASDIYCAAEVDGKSYLGTFYLSTLTSGEGDWTKLSRYPCNNLTLREAAYAYLYVKEPDGTPYEGNIIFRGGVYINGTYLRGALFRLNSGNAGQSGAEDQVVQLGSDGLLTITMDQQQWENEVGKITAKTDVSYVFEIKSAGSNKLENDIYYPMLLTVDANVNKDAFVGSGEAIVNFRTNTEGGEHPFIAFQANYYTDYPDLTSLLDYTGKIGPTDSLDEATLTTAVMWWGDQNVSRNPKLQLITETGIPVADGEGLYTIEQNIYPFVAEQITQYTVKLNKASMDGILDGGESTGIYLDYYADGSTLSRHESLAFQLCNMLGMGKVEGSKDVSTQLQNMGHYVGTKASSGNDIKFFSDQFVSTAMDLVAKDSYSTEDASMFRIQISPTTDPTKFLGFIEVNVGNMNDQDQVTGVYAQGNNSRKADLDYTPGLNELMTMAGKRSLYSYLGDDFNKVLKREGVRNLSFQLGGYAESLIYYNNVSGRWEIQILDGGFNVGGGVSYTWSWNTMVGPVPFTASLTIGGTAEVSMDALSVAYYNTNKDFSGLGNDFLTQLRIYLYLRFFAGVGIDYAIVAFKLGIYGQINLDMQFQWLNRPYMDGTSDDIMNVADGTHNEPYSETIPGNEALGIPDMVVWKSPHSTLNGQHFQIDGQIGLEFVVRILFFSYEQILYSYSFNLLNESTGNWDTIQSNWDKNSAASQAAISTLLGNKSLSVTNVGGQQMLSLNLAPTLESRDYLEDGRVWGDFGIGLFSLDEKNALENLEYNSYPYANPVISDDGQLVAFLSDMDSSEVTDTRAAFAVMDDNGFFSNEGAISDGGYGDSQVSLSGTKRFAVAAWTRQTKGIDKDAGATLTAQDQMIMMNSSEIYAGVYQNGTWTAPEALTENSSADLAPVVATNGEKAIVAWRAVAASGEKNSDGYADVTTFDEKDTILYRIYENGSWGQTQTLYNGTSGAVKGIVAAMMDDGTAAVAYTLDTDKDSGTITDREIYYAVIARDSGEVTRNVRATNDAYLDENPQLTAVTFPSTKKTEEDDGEQRFVLGWYTEQAVSSDSASTLDAGETETTNTTTSDVRLLDFDKNGIYTQLLPDSISQVADAYDVSITPTFRFTKNSSSINDLSILWVERAEGTIQALEVQPDNKDTAISKELTEMAAERDVLKGVKFYTYGANDEIVTFTGAIDVAEMNTGTLIDHFDAYVSDAENNEIKAVILGTTYGEDDAITKTRTTVNNETVTYTVPSRTTSMYTATETYSDKIDVPAILPEYEAIKKGATTQIMFTVKNNGIHAISALDITVGEGENSTLTSIPNLNLLPGSSIQLYADYTVPTEKVIDPPYTVTATFNTEQGATGSAGSGETIGSSGMRSPQRDNVSTGTVYLDLPDVEITDAKIMTEEKGLRTIQVQLNNSSHAALTNSGRKVKIGFYTDATCVTPFASGYGLDEFVIDQDADLQMLDGGGYSKQVTFDVSKYLDDVLSTDEYEVTEIPDGGIAVYIRAEVQEQNSDDEWETLPEPISSNNSAAVTVENLKTRTGKDVSITSSFSVEGGNTVVTAYLQNNRLSQTSTGNVIVTLLNSDGEVIDQQQSYTGETGDTVLLKLEKEQKKPVTFTFKDVTNAASVQVVYSDLILNANNANLASLTFNNIPGLTLKDFKPDESGVYRATVTTDDLTSTTVIAVTETALARAKAFSDKDKDDGESAGGNAISKTVALKPGEENTVTVFVKSIDGTEEKTYILTIKNNGDPTITIDRDAETEYSASVVYNGSESATIKLTAAAKPETSGYNMTYQWYSCDPSGTVLSEIPASVASDTTSADLTISSTIDAGVHYYICEITREMLDHSIKTYKSSVASVKITQAEGNSVTANGLTVDYDGNSHQLPAATADKSGSTIYYSTDYGTAATPTWRTDAPSFTEVGVHTVWVYATNNNYRDTAIITADVLIQGAPEISKPTVTINEGFGTSVVYASGSSADISITATQNPLQSQYQLSYQWYECDVTGQENLTELAGKTGSTLTVPSTVGAGVHYYICKITRQMLDGSATDYWSSVASVQINKASGNSVTLEGTELTFDNASHGLTSAKAEKDGSTIYYSTTSSGPWSTEMPKFTAVGVHTVWAYATNPNYENTAVVTAAVVIREKESTQFKLETNSIEEAFSGYPSVITEKYADASALETALKAEVVKLGASRDDTEVYDIKLLFSLDDGETWNEATAENFPSAGITVILPYPDGTDRYSYNFTLQHLIVDPLNTGKPAGTLENMDDITLTDKGIRFTADCLSPFVLGWYPRPTSSGDSDSSTYTVAAEDTEHGTFTVSPSRADYNSTVTITAKPDEGYKVGSVTVTTQNGRELTVTNKGNNIYTFKMPSGGVSVKVSFVKSTEAATNPFTDVPASAYYHDAVLWAVENGVTSGTTSTTFSPDESCTRAQAVTFLWRAAGSPAPKATSSPFTDVSVSAYYYDAVLWAVENGITAGTSATTFSPNDTCTRAQIVTFLWRAAGSTLETASNPFADVSAGAYYYDAVLWAVKNEVTAGTSTTTFSPDLNCTRAQIVTFLYRAK